MNVIKVTNKSGLELLKTWLREKWAKSLPVGFDIETNVVSTFIQRKIRTMQFGDRDTQFVVDLLAFSDYKSEILSGYQGNYGRNLYEGWSELLSVVKNVLETNRMLKVGVNLGFEYTMCYWCFGIRMYHMFDNSVMERLIWAGYYPLSDFDYYGMEQMWERYFRSSIDKSLQTSFSIDQPLTDAQYEYAALDTRLPLALRDSQLLILQGRTYRGLQASKGQVGAQRLAHLPAKITGDNMMEMAQLENDAIGSFAEMHVHGEDFNTEKWNAKVDDDVASMKDLIENKLDPIFIPFVGLKTIVITDEQIAEAHAKWNTIKYKKIKSELPDPETGKHFLIPETEEDEQKAALRAVLKKAHGDLKKQRTKIKNLIAKCEGNALINYGGRTQVPNVLREKFPELKDIPNIAAETLEQFEDMPVMQHLKEYARLKKQIGTYGYSWSKPWTNKPEKEDGWLWPDGKLHCVFNQLAADTGRSSSEKPNGQNLTRGEKTRSCFEAGAADEFAPEGYDLITIDMAGAELCILAEMSREPSWIGAFNRDEDVHSVCCELVDSEEWKALSEPGCAFYKLGNNGLPEKKKCKCPRHNEKRNDFKPTNFGVPYGIGPAALAPQIGKTKAEAKEVLSAHARALPVLHAYLKKIGDEAVRNMKAFTLFGRRRGFNAPTYESSLKYAMEDREETLRFEEEEIEAVLKAFEEKNGRKPNGKMETVGTEAYALTHREPTAKEQNYAYNGLLGFIERQGKNHPIQGGNCDIIKLAMGAGHDKDGVPYLWHILPRYHATLLKLVHDELVIRVPKRFSLEVAKLAEDAIKRAAATKLKLVTMKSDYHIAFCWTK
jgi:DNA polymerase I-like protein with 3'-5' exonuclease and polymerase domains